MPNSVLPYVVGKSKSFGLEFCLYLVINYHKYTYFFGTIGHIQINWVTKKLFYLAMKNMGLCLYMLTLESGAYQ